MLRYGSGTDFTPAIVARMLGLDVDYATDLLADLHVWGWIEVEEQADDIFVSLSPMAQERLSAASAPVTAHRPAWGRISSRLAVAVGVGTAS